MSGVYVPQGSPYVTWIVSGLLCICRQMRITESRGAISLANDFTYDSVTNAWSYNRGGKRLKTSTTANLANGDQQVTKVISDPSTGVVALKTIETKHTFRGARKSSSVSKIRMDRRSPRIIHSPRMLQMAAAMEN